VLISPMALAHGTAVHVAWMNWRPSSSLLKLQSCVNLGRFHNSRFFWGWFISPMLNPPTGRTWDYTLFGPCPSTCPT
jgi:hypothetical protein